MRTIIAGSRTLDDRLGIFALLDRSYPFVISEVVSGCARGVDQIGEDWARSKGLPVRLFPANWEKYGKAAGYLRNEEMAKHASALIAIWDGESKGTKHMIDLALTHKLWTVVIIP